MIRLALLSNVTNNILAQCLSKDCSVWMPDGYDTWFQALLDPESVLYANKPEIVFVLLDGGALLDKCACLAEAEPLFERCRAAFSSLAQQLPDSLILIASLDIPHRRILPLSARRPEREWEHLWWDLVAHLSETHSNVFLFEFKEIVERLGRDQFYSAKMWYAGNIPFSMKGYEAVALEMRYIIRGWQGARGKCLALDLDNTLWGGVIGEDGVDGVQLAESKEGAIYKDFQRRLKELEATGVSLVVLSKNNRQEAIAAIEKHPHMVLRMGDFVDMEINWEEKPSNLARIVQRLNFGLDACVFVDDNPVERAAMEQFQPAVRVASFPKDKVQLPCFAQALYKQYFFCLRSTHEDQQKTALYQTEDKRKSLRQQCGSVTDYIRSLEIRIRFALAEESDLERVAQLTQKTNQFNLTTKRYTIGDVRRMFSEPDQWAIFTVRAADKFGDSGLIAVGIVRLEVDYAEIDAFLMSCRVMGRTIEENVVVLMEDALRVKGFSEIRARYIPTEKNAPVLEFYDKCGFTLIRASPSGEKTYVFDLAQHRECNGLMEILS